eukprot:1307366-Amphidinium_carterae.1
MSLSERSCSSLRSSPRVRRCSTTAKQECSCDVLRGFAALLPSGVFCPVKRLALWGSTLRGAIHRHLRPTYGISIDSLRPVLGANWRSHTPPQVALLKSMKQLCCGLSLQKLPCY